MLRSSPANRLAVAGLIIQAAIGLPAGAAPLPSTAAFDEPNASERASDSELALRGARLDLPDDAENGLQRELLGPQAGRHPDAGSGPSFDLGRGPDSFASPAGSTLHDMLRSFVNVRPGSNPARRPAPGAGARAPEEAIGIDVGLASNEWIRDSVEEILTSVLSLNVDERGQTAFSVLGWGEFSVVVSADRSEIELRTGDEAIVLAQRTAAGTQGGSGYADGYAQHHPGFGGAAGRNADPQGESPLRRAIALLVELVTHPISILVYALVAGYALVFSVLSRRATRPIPAPGSHRRSRHRSSVTRAAPAAVAASAAEKPQRKRVRVRVRVRKYRR